MKNATDCLDCPGGQYCELSGQANSTGPCLPGYFCEKSATAMPTGIGGDVCPKGHFCENVSKPTLFRGSLASLKISMSVALSSAIHPLHVSRPTW